MSSTTYQVCTRCVMDTSDPAITFDADGICNHCWKFEATSKKYWFPNDEGKKRLSILIEKIRTEGRSKEYDCIIGLSGGVDSSYLALKTKEWGLRPLVVHVDAGWNSELAVSNIERIVKHCGYHLHTYVVDWAEMQDLHLSYFRAAIPNQDAPQDHAFFANLYGFAIENRLKYVLTGGNMATEGVFPSAWQGSAMDAINLKAIHKQYGTRPLRHYRTIGFLGYYFYYPFIRGLRTFRPLDYLPYVKDEAARELEQKIGWRAYRYKHGESIYTKFFQNYYLPQKFGYDKRKPHMSSLILSGQLTRDQALAALAEPLYKPEELDRDIAYMANKLGLTVPEFHELMAAKPGSHRDFANWEGRQALAKSLSTLVSRMTGKEIKVYS